MEIFIETFFWFICLFLLTGFIIFITKNSNLIFRPKKKYRGTERILEERQLQIRLGYDRKYDDEHTQGELVQLGMAYASHGTLAPNSLQEDILWDGVGFFPKELSKKQWKPYQKPSRMTINDRICHLSIAGAMMAAEIDRLQRKKERG